MDERAMDDYREENLRLAAGLAEALAHIEADHASMDTATERLNEVAARNRGLRQRVAATEAALYEARAKREDLANRLESAHEMNEAMSGQLRDALAERDEAQAIRRGAERDRDAAYEARDAWMKQATDQGRRTEYYERQYGNARAAWQMVQTARGAMGDLMQLLDHADESFDTVIDEPKCNCGATELLPRHFDPACPFHGTESGLL